MTSAERREQLISVSRELFAQKGFEGTSVEEIAATAQVSKPVVYEHFGGKEGLYAVVVDREVTRLHHAIRTALTTPDATSRELIEYGALALMDYLDEHPDGFRILARDSSVVAAQGSFASILSDIVGRVEGLLAEPLKRHGFNPGFAGTYAQALVGLVALAGQSWLDTRQPPKEVVAAHLVNLAWNGMANLVPEPQLTVREMPTEGAGRRRNRRPGV
ncbi:TetR/AcrR family transcriptional regulator [Luteococcus sp. H138]|uniref:TetR/AcrR family transcriptional regulator n=1 Tax=unclassified Luteococcus TaxID=2639923 RepID=UPI00313D221F